MGTSSRLAFLVAAGGLMLAACSPGSTPAAGSAGPAPVNVQSPVPEAALTTVTLTAEAEARLGIETAPVERLSLARTRAVGGEVIAPPGAETTITAPFTGILEAPAGLPAVGTQVGRGRTIFRLVPLAPAERDARVDAERAVADAVARQEVVAKRTRRAEQLARDGAGSRRAAEEAQAELEMANAEVKAARDRLALAERGNASPGGGIALNAPYAALLRNVHATPGQTVAAAAPLFDLVRLDPLWVRVPLYVGDTDDVAPDAPARVVGLGDGPDSEGVLARPVPAPPSADASTAAVDLYFSIAGGDGELRPGQRVSVRLARRGTADSLVVPRAALLHDAYGGTWVYEAREPHVFVRRRVSVADLAGTVAVLEQGPAPGARVVTDGAAELFGTEFGVGK